MMSIDFSRSAIDYSDVRLCLFFFQAEDGIRDLTVTGVQTCALPISRRTRDAGDRGRRDRPEAGRRGSRVALAHPAAAARRLSPRRSGDGSGARGPRLGAARPGSTPSASGSHVPAVSVRRGRAARDPRGARRRFQRLGRHAHPDATVPARRFRLDRGVAAVARALSLRLPRRRLPLARRSRGAASARRRVRRAELGRHRGWLVMPRSLAAAGALAALLAATAVAQDPRLGRLDATRSEEHTSELQSQSNLVCRLLLEKKKKY